MEVGFFATLAISFVLTVVFARIFIPVLKSVKMGQKILEIGPRWHKSKEGTPTMGGLFFIAAAVIPVVACIIRHGGTELAVSYVFVLLNGLIGFIDDYVKFFKKQNQGLTAKQKLVLQFASAAAYVAVMWKIGAISSSVVLPFVNTTVKTGILYYVILTVGIVFTVNSTNLTDGIDGLCSSVTAVAAIFLSVLAFKSGNAQSGVLTASLLGGTLGFLVYNFHPARVFMGDTGSLYIGAVLCSAAIMLDVHIILLFAGIIYYVEAVSVMLQVFCFKLFGKRIFKMAPIHHHFEMCGWGEVKIVFVFSVVTAIFAAIGCYGLLGAM